MTDAYIKGKNSEELLADLYGKGEPGSVVHEQIKTAAYVRGLQELGEAVSALRRSMEENAQQSDKLAKRVFWLNWALLGATVVGAIATAIQAWAALHGKT